ncbi:F-box/LRR-repeat protein 25-like [Bidens hawaiensis]|uniref:F-box/LRR-repeat protein 25-like n=1 Tax=Bidens hawaiensis TaxID=980011 RepID=UPI00404B6798
MEEDRISSLPDCLLVEVLSCLRETKHAARTGSLSKRWKRIWHSVPSLAFRHTYRTQGRVSPEFMYFVDKTLTQRPQSKLNKFMLSAYYANHNVYQINSWIRYAVNCDVENLCLGLWNTEHEANFPLDKELFSRNSCVTTLSLSGCMFHPSTTISLKNLRSLNVMFVELGDNLIENILSGSPVLETLTLEFCYGYRSLNITSKSVSVKNLALSGCPNSHYLDDRTLEINAPNILSLTIEGVLGLDKLLLPNVSSLVEVNLDFEVVTLNWGYDAIHEEEMLKGIIFQLRHAKELKIGSECFKVLSRLKAKGFICPSNLKVTGDEVS